MVKDKSKGKEIEKELIVLDIVEHDTIAALQYLLGLCDENRVAGIIFAVALKKERTRPHICGSTGRLATNMVEAAGVGGMLSLKLTQEALEQAIGPK